jgi:putative serine protease PepD
MPDSAPLWSGRRARATDHAWLAPVPEPPSRPPEDEPGPPEPPKGRRTLLLVAALTAALTALLATVVLLVTGTGATKTRTVETPAVATGRVPQTQVNRIYAAVSGGVVQVRTSGGSGSGFVIDGDGTIVTNAHVVEGVNSAQVRFDTHSRPIEATVVGTDQSSDLAVLHVDPSKVGTLRPLALADSDQVQVGDSAVAIGFPLGLDKTATAGIVSGLGREIRAPNGFSIDKVIQTDAPINPGNSGGPLLDAKGRVIGINSQIATAGNSQGNLGIGFAVPSNTVRSVVPKLKQGQTVAHAWLGVSTAGGSALGAVIADITSGSPAAKAGLQRGDVIVSVDGQAVGSPDDLNRAIDGHSPGDQVRMDVLRGGVQQESVTVTLAQRPNHVP